tara:strand:- start:262 stop:414 length:153 start_codon:yes stop_codon:yes gene_type:complete
MKLYRIQLQDGKYNTIYTICADSVEQAFKRICNVQEPYYNPEWGYKQLTD